MPLPQFYNEYSDFKRQAKEISSRETLLAPLLNEVIVSSANFAEAISILLASSFATNFIPRQSWYDIFLPTFDGQNGLYEGQDVISLLVNDIMAIQERDPACTNLVQAFLYFKGFKSLQAHRAAHILWAQGRKDIAFAIQSRTSELWAVDIHPGAKLGGGLMIDHGTGLVVGETAVVGRNCSFLHGVTLGSTGKDQGDRHPKLGDDVLVGCNSIILGNIKIGRSAKIGSGSVVIKSIPDFVTAVGNPARIVGNSEERTKSAAKEMDLALAHVISPCGAHFNSTWTSFADGSVAFEDIDVAGKGCISKQDLHDLFKLRCGHDISDNCVDMIFPILDWNNDGKICKQDFDERFPKLQPLLKGKFACDNPSSNGSHQHGRKSKNSSPARIIPASRQRSIDNGENIHHTAQDILQSSDSTKAEVGVCHQNTSSVQISTTDISIAYKRSRSRSLGQSISRNGSNTRGREREIRENDVNINQNENSHQDANTSSSERKSDDWTYSKDNISYNNSDSNNSSNTTNQNVTEKDDNDINNQMSRNVDSDELNVTEYPSHEGNHRSDSISSTDDDFHFEDAGAMSHESSPRSIGDDSSDDMDHIVLSYMKRMTNMDTSIHFETMHGAYI